MKNKFKKNRNLKLRCSDGCKNRLIIEDVTCNKYLIQIISPYKPKFRHKLVDCYNFLTGKWWLPKSDNILLAKKQLEKINKFINKK